MGNAKVVRRILLEIARAVFLVHGQITAVLLGSAFSPRQSH